MQTMNLLLSISSILLLLHSIDAFRGNTQRGSTAAASSSNQLNIGLIAPHTNFGKLEEIKSVLDLCK